MGHVTNQYYEIMQKTGLASIVALTTKKNPFPQITKTFISDKIGRYKNEINRFRYDVLFEVNHSRQWQEEVPLYKYQFGMCDFLNTNERAV